MTNEAKLERQLGERALLVNASGGQGAGRPVIVEAGAGEHHAANAASAHSDAAGRHGRGHHLSPEEMHQKELTAYMFLFFIVVLQVALFRVKAKYPKRFQEVTLGFLFAYPMLVLYRHQDAVSICFVAVWLAWSAQTGVLMREAMKRPLANKTPERVYTWFLRTHNVCYVLGMGSLYSFLLIPGPALTVLFFALYFAVLGRDFAEICAERISSTIGYSKYETPPHNLCALCGDELRPTLEMMAGELDESENAPKVYKLSCGHEFHATCISGWCIVGKKQSCPFCMEKVDLKSVLPDIPWNSKRISVLWLRLIDVLRFLVVWNPIIVYFDLFLLKMLHFSPLVDQAVPSASSSQ